jgi:hypothetical protein
MLGAGLVEVFVDDDGREAYRLTDDGVRVGHIVAMGGESDADAILEALLGASGADTPDRKGRGHEGTGATLPGSGWTAAIRTG